MQSRNVIPAYAAAVLMHNHYRQVSVVTNAFTQLGQQISFMSFQPYYITTAGVLLAILQLQMPFQQLIKSSKQGNLRYVDHSDWHMCQEILQVQ